MSGELCLHLANVWTDILYPQLLCLAAGMSTFSTRGGLYERAQKRFGLADGKRLFTYAFFEKRRLEALVRFS